MSGTRVKAYLYSAIFSTFCFVILREMGLIGQASHVQFGDQPLRHLRPVILRAKSSSKYLNDAILKRGMKSKKFENEAMVDSKAKTNNDWSKTTEDEMEPDAGPSRRGLDRRADKKSSSRRYQDFGAASENEGAEHDDSGRFESDLGSSVRSSSRRTSKASRASRRFTEDQDNTIPSRGDRDDQDTKPSRGRWDDHDYQDRRGKYDDRDDQDSKPSRGRRDDQDYQDRGGNKGDYDNKSRADSIPKRKASRSVSQKLPNDSNEEEPIEPVRPRKDRFSNRPESDMDNNENDRDGDNEGYDSKHSKSGGSSKRNSYSDESSSGRDSQGDYNEGNDNIGMQGAHRRDSRDSRSDEAEAQPDGEGKYDTANDAAERRVKRKATLENDNSYSAGEKENTDAGYEPAVDNGSKRKKQSQSSQPENDGQAESDRESNSKSESDPTDVEPRLAKQRPKVADADSEGEPSSSETNTEPPESAEAADPDPKGQKSPLLTMDKPRIYTFFTGVQDRKANTGMTDDADNQLLETWKFEWSQAGWKPVILTLETAKKHPDFEPINAMLDGPFGEYDRYCFLRWLAVAVVGGGFAVDYDTLPFTFVMNTLPNGGKLTIHENSDVGGVPSLVSANAEEYTKFAWDLARNLESHKGETHWSDMKAMQDMYQKSKGKAYIMESNVMSALEVLNGRGYDPYNCGIVEGKYAIHFSHHAIKFGKLWEGVGPEDRASIGREWLKGWRKSCKWRVSGELS